MSIVPQAQAKAIAAERGWRIKEARPNGGLMELHAIYNGLPYYYKTYNRAAADSVSTDECWPGGLSGYNLTGAGITLGIWDGDGVRVTHQEFGGRAVQRDVTSGYTNHATHVAGTLIAAGVNAAAKGMSFEANLDCFDWNSDIYEMNKEAAAGMRVSNHSYGPITGWDYSEDECNTTGSYWWWLGDVTVSIVEDYRFGFYHYDAQEFDQVAYDNPYYLICCAAGNDRNEGPGGIRLHCYYDENGDIADTSGGASVFRYDDGGNSGGYDTISGSGLGKNVLCVGAVEDVNGGYTQPSDVVMTTFSCWGPADDGRIKPDIVGNGRCLISPLAGSDTQYAGAYLDYSGTSMSAPNVAGSLGLLIQHWRNTHPGQADMLSSTLKALVLHTADECGASDGPDYKFGWGLLNTWKAAAVISEDVTHPATITEQNVNASAPVSVVITTDGSSSELRATICWVDLPGNIPPPAVDPTVEMLINDLDMSIFSTTRALNYYPWILDPANPTAAATTGDNNVDNVEQIVIKNPGADTWMLHVAADGPLANGAQRFSLIVTGAATVVVDCNDNNIPDSTDVASGTSEDCNANQVPDECEIAPTGASPDCNNDGILDECQLADHDCNLNGILDSCDIANGDNEDCDGNGVPDTCELDAPVVQMPDAYEMWVADSDCDVCPSLGFPVEQTAAENFIIREAKTIDSVVIWGTYSTDGSVPDQDHFTVRFLEANGQELGSLVASQTDVTCIRVSTGNVIFDDEQEFRFTLLLNPAVTLAPGTYFVEIFNDTTGDPATFWWESGTLDPEAGVDGLVDGDSTPAGTGGAEVRYNAGYNLSLHLVVASPDVDCNADGLLDACYPAITVDLGADRELAPDRTYDPIAPNMVINGGTGTLKYNWQIIAGPSPLGIGNPFSQNPKFTPPAEGTYVIRCTVQDASVGPCTVSDDIAIKVQPLAVNLSDTLYACVDTRTLPLGSIPLATGGTPPYSYFWEVLEGPTEFSETAQTQANPTLLPPTEDDYILQVTVTDSSNPPYVASKTAQVVVEVAPSVDAGKVSQYHPIIMVNQTLDLGGAPTATGGHQPYEYGWSIPVNPGGAGSVSDVTAANPTFSATEKGGYVVRVQITDLGGCSAETQFTVSVVTDPPSSLVPITPAPSDVACGMCAPANGATIALFFAGYLAVYAGLRRRRNR